jgi:hypothetical protein
MIPYLAIPYTNFDHKMYVQVVKFDHVLIFSLFQGPTFYFELVMHMTIDRTKCILLFML